MKDLLHNCKENEQVCLFCDIAEFSFFVTFPFALPWLIILSSVS